MFGKCIVAILVRVAVMAGVGSARRSPTEGAGEDQSALEQLFAQINSLGKRGGFWQFMGAERVEGDLPFGFTICGIRLLWHYGQLGN